MAPPDLGSLRSRGAPWLSHRHGQRSRRPIREALKRALETTQRRADDPPMGELHLFRPAACRSARSTNFRPPPELGCGAARCVTPRQACPRPGWPRAQLAFKDSMVRGILQFTPSIAFRYVLHRCESRDIRCRESSNFFESPLAALGADGGARRRTSSHSPSPAPLWVLGANRALGASVVRRARPSAGAAAGGSPASPRPASSRCRGGRGGPPSRCVMVTQFAGLPSFGPRQ